jgi:3alpha(or 20beta)-hydroxysteroid dehydrogenase
MGSSADSLDIRRPIRRMAEPDEVSKLVLFLACDDSSYISGMEHVIDGGLTAS